MRISSKWTPEERLQVIDALAITIEKEEFAYLTKNAAFVIRLVGRESAEYLEKNRETIFKTAKLDDSPE